MRIEKLEKRSLNPKEYVKRFALESDIERVIDEPCMFYEGDSLKIVYDKIDWDSSGLVHALRTIDYNRSQRVAGLITTSAIFGYTPRRIIYADYCRTTDMSYRFPEQHALICHYSKRVSEEYHKFNPELYAKHSEKASAVRPRWLLEGTPFTSGIANKDNQLKYHFDSGNFKGTWSCMLAFKKHVSGGRLSLPEYGIGIEIANDTLLMFDGQSILHGVTPIIKTSNEAYRITVVYYSLQQMWKCGEPEEELARIKRVKTEREARRATGNAKVD